MIRTNDEALAKKINSAVFPGTQGGPLMHVIAAKAVAFGEALRPEFKAYARQVVDNAQALAETLKGLGFGIVTGGTDNHLMLVDLRSKKLTGKAAEAALNRAHLTCNKNAIPFDPAFSGELTGEARAQSEAQDHASEVTAAQEAFSERQAVARRAYLELFNTDKERPVVNYGVGVPDAVAKLLSARGEMHRIYQTIEHGTYGGTLLDGVLFGYARNASAMLDAATQFDFYAGGGLDIAFLGFGEFDAQGNVNVSRLGGLTVGPGGFIDIAQNARKVVFCGTFAAKGVRLQTGDGQMRVLQQGAVKKLVPQVEQITFSGAQSLVRGQQVLYLTERASFRLTPQGVELFEIAPGIDLQRDVLDPMGFVPQIAQHLGVMDVAHFVAAAPKMG
jgi:acyl CoA:acetate/3-ketoacid CoA transferase